MKVTLFFVPMYPARNRAIDFDEGDPIVFDDHVGAVIPLVGDIIWVTSPAPAEERIAVCIVERGFAYGSRGIKVSLHWDFLQQPEAESIRY